MTRNIAVYVGENGETATLNQGGKLVVYTKEEGQWGVLRETSFPAAQGGMGEIRKRIEEIINSATDCDVFIGLSLTGLIYHALEKANFSIWECEGNPLEILDEILAKEEAAELEEAVEEEIPAPVDLGNGQYRISLNEIQKKDSSFTSKQVLLPFLRQVKFYSLEIICSHVPKWIEMEIAAGSYTSQVEQLAPNEMKVTLSPKVCS